MGVLVAAVNMPTNQRVLSRWRAGGGRLVEQRERVLVGGVLPRQILPSDIIEAELGSVLEALCREVFAQPPSTDSAAAFRTAGDATGTLIGTSMLDWTFPLLELTFNFQGARIHLRDLDGDMEVLDHCSGRHEVYAIARDRSRWQQYDDTFTKSILAYLETLRQNAPPPVPGLAGLQELQVEAAIKRSIATGRPVDLDADLPLGL